MRSKLLSLFALALVTSASRARASADDQGFPLPPGALTRLGSLSMRQSGGVNALLFTGDDSRLLAAGTAGAIYSWDPATGALMGRFGINSRSIVSLTKNEDETIFYAGGIESFLARFRRGDLSRPEEMKTRGDQPVVSPAFDRICVVAENQIDFDLLDIEGKFIKTVETKGLKAVESVFSDDGSLLAVTSFSIPSDKGKAHRQPTIRIVEVQAAAGEDEVRMLTLPEGLSLKRVRFLPDNRRMLAAGIDGVLRMIDIENMVVEPAVKFSVEAGTALALTPDASIAAVGDGDGSVSVFKVDGLSMIQSFPAHESPVTAIALSMDGARVATGGSDSTVRVFEVETGNQLAGPIGHDAQVSCVAASPDLSTFATGTVRGRLHVWDAQTGAMRYAVTANPGSVNRLEFSKQGDTIIAAGQDGNVLFFDAKDGTEKKRVAGDGSAAMDLALGHDGSLVYVAFAHNQMRAFDAATGEEKLLVDARSPSFLFSIAVSGDGSKIALGASAIRIVDPKGATLLDITDCRAPVEGLAFAPDGATLVAGLADGTIRAYDTTSGKELRRAQFGSGRVKRVAISQDGKSVVASSDSENVVRVFAFDTLALERELDGHTEPVLGVVFVGDDKIASASADSTALIWKR